MKPDESSPLFPSQLLDRLTEAGVVAVLVVERGEDAVPLAKALLDGGVRAIELTLRTPAALDSVHRISRQLPEMLLGVGTILTPDQVDQAVQAGASFGVAPGFNPRTLQAARRAGLPFAPGVCTPSEIELAVEAGARLLKLFPAEPSGGLAYLRTIAAPFRHLGLRFLPLGGIDPDNASDYFSEPLVAAIGGSWLAPSDQIALGQWGEVTRRAAAINALMQRTRQA